MWIAWSSAIEARAERAKNIMDPFYFMSAGHHSFTSALIAEH